MAVSDASRPVNGESRPVNGGATPVNDGRIHRGETSSCGAELTAQVVNGTVETDFTDEGLWCMPDATNPPRSQFGAIARAITWAFYWSGSFTGLRQNAIGIRETGDIELTDGGNTKERYSIHFANTV